MTTLLRVTEQRHERIVTALGAAFLVVTAVVAMTFYAFAHFSSHSTKNTISVSIDTPYVGQGVAEGTQVILHGLQVGEVKALSKVSGGGVRLNIDLQRAPTAGLTDAVGIDFRPANNFGVTGINLIPADRGQPLHNGVSLTVTPAGNFTLQTLLYRMGALAHQVATPKLISVVERVTRYTDALNPLFETMITVSRTVTDVQTVSTQQLLRNTAAISVGLPAFLDAAISVGDEYLTTDVGTGFDATKDRANNPYLSMYDEVALNNYNEATHELASDPDKFAFGRFAEWLNGAEFDLFSKVGNLLSSHIYDLFPVLNHIRVLADVVPRLVKPDDLADKLRELRTRLERMYQGSADQRALQVRVVLDQLPGVQAPLAPLMLGLGAQG